jgi:hypothetical protein
MLAHWTKGSRERHVVSGVHAHAHAHAHTHPWGYVHRLRFVIVIIVVVVDWTSSINDIAELCVVGQP